MRIDAYNQVAQLYGVQQKSYSAPTKGKGSSMGSDQLSISQVGYDHQVAKSAVSEASDVREDKVAKIKAMVDAGTYSVNPEDFASKLLNKYNNVLA
ncbi:MAG: flagellar biosynthesis anti-sigma factor FlgM [Agathobacter sp.]|nr:flagellar biosynthesis anti-sigma factor FlgM [Agathobacter sp.]